MQEQTSDGRWVTLPEAASLLGVSIITLRRSLKRGLLDGQLIVTKYGPTWLVWIDHVPANAISDRPEVADVALNELVRRVERLEESNRILTVEVGHLHTQLGQVRQRVGELETRLTEPPSLAHP